MHINDLLNRRTDLSTFVVHLTRTDGLETAKSRLEAILRQGSIQARTVFGWLKGRCTTPAQRDDQRKFKRSVCFTETPLEHCHLLLEDLEPQRRIRFEPYGIALPKKLARSWGVNPVWYVDTSRGRTWFIARALDALANDFVSGARENVELAQVFPFVEQMGEGPKEFWWEREWRHVGSFQLPYRLICLCPEAEFDHFRAVERPFPIELVCVDPKWGLENIIARLAGYSAPELDLFTAETEE